MSKIFTLNKQIIWFIKVITILIQYFKMLFLFLILYILMDKSCLRFLVIKSVRGILRLKSWRPIPLKGESENGNWESLGKMSDCGIIEGGRFMHIGVPINAVHEELAPSRM